jgi:hypothetical protein
MVPFMSSTVITLAPSIAKISFAHSLRISSSAYDIFTHSFVYPSGPGDLSAFKQLSTELLNSLSVTLPFADVWEKFGGSSADQPVPSSIDMFENDVENVQRCQAAERFTSKQLSK